MINLRDVSKSFETNKVLNKVNLEVNDSSIFGLVGVNGSGKTTLLRCIAGIYEVEDGEVMFNEANTFKDNLIRRDIFFISDDPYYPFGSNINTIKEFYKSFYEFDENEYNKYLELFNLDPNKQISSFSKGMKRQVMLLMALSIKPKLLLLDEAFDGLDPVVRLTIKKALSDLMEDNNSIIIISSHNLKELEDICDSYGILENGKINTYGDLLESKELINKYQLAYNTEVNEDIFNGLDIINLSKEGSIYRLVIRGNKEEIIEKLNKTNPILLDCLSVNFEELFIYLHEEVKK